MATLVASTALTANRAALAPPTTVRICHATSSQSNPYVSNEPAIGNNGDLQGGHLNHANDIVPPYSYVDENGEPQTYPGKNWDDNGQTIWENGCKPVTPIPTPTGTIVVVKQLIPSDDPGTFDLKVGEDTVAAGAGNGEGGAIDVAPGTHTVSESGHGRTVLDDYSIQSRCTTSDGRDVGTSHGSSVSGVTVAQGETVTCTFTNTAKLPPDSASVTPILECVLFGDGQPDVAYWGYDNTSGHIVTIARGDPQNTFDPASANGEQPEQFVEGRQAGVFTTDFDASGGSLVWRLTGNAATASAGSPPCDATIEVQKITVPSNDPGVFNLLINNTLVKTGGNGTTTGHLRIGTGEGTVRETAGPGTNLEDYTSHVECTRNGTVAVSVPGTKVDATIEAGDTVVCTFTNTRRGTPPELPMPLPPTPPDPDPPPVPAPPPGPAPQLDLVVIKSVQPETVVVGGRLTWTMIVTNRSSVAAADVNGLKLNERSLRTRLISLRASQGTCRPYACDLGRLAPGASATVTAVTEATRVGLVVDVVRVSSEEIESNYRNNVAAASARVVGRLTPPVGQNRCDTLTVAPRVLESGRSSVVLLTARNRRGQPLAGVRVRVHGPGVDRIVTTDRQGTVRRTVLPTRIGLVFFTGIPRTLTNRGSHCRTLLGVLRAKQTAVTG
jgi:hypothetical protein